MVSHCIKFLKFFSSIISRNNSPIFLHILYLKFHLWGDREIFLNNLRSSIQGCNIQNVRYLLYNNYIIKDHEIPFHSIGCWAIKTASFELVTLITSYILHRQIPRSKILYALTTMSQRAVILNNQHIYEFLLFNIYQFWGKIGTKSTSWKRLGVKIAHRNNLLNILYIFSKFNCLY
jgi:hypothetical protein